MKIQYCSDLHIEFRENKNFLNETPLSPIGEILILAGDVVPFSIMEKYRDFFDFISDHFALTYWLPGNHEYYHSDLSNRSGFLHEKIRDNIHLVNNYQAIHNNVRFIFSTLWTHLSIENQWQIQQGMSDFRVITLTNKLLTASEYNLQHKSNLKFIRKQIKQPYDKTVVATHHVPTFINYPEQYKGDVLNEAFAVELYDVIETSGVDYWIYGHHHQNISPFEIGTTKLVTNQLGYVRHNEHKTFSPNKYFTLT